MPNTNIEEKKEKKEKKETKSYYSKLLMKFTERHDNSTPMTSRVTGLVTMYCFEYTHQ